MASRKVFPLRLSSSSDISRRIFTSPISPAFSTDECAWKCKTQSLFSKNVKVTAYSHLFLRRINFRIIQYLFYCKLHVQRESNPPPPCGFLNFNFWVCLLSKWRHCWRQVISNMFVDIINVFYFIMTCHRQRSTKLSASYANVWTHAFWPTVDILSILCELGSRA